MAKRNISISTTFEDSIPIEQQIKLVSEAGFNYISLGGNQEHSRFMSREGRKELKLLLDKFSVSIDTIHGCRADSLQRKKYQKIFWNQHIIQDVDFMMILEINRKRDG